MNHKDNKAEAFASTVAQTFKIVFSGKGTQLIPLFISRRNEFHTNYTIYEIISMISKPPVHTVER